MTTNEDAIQKLIEGFSILLKEAIKNTTKIYSGVIISQGSNGKWNIRYNGETHLISSYGNITPVIGNMVKVIIPDGNQNLAFFI